ncbi:7388_t:CDS:2, partial [Gigaspora margarita]
NDMDDDIDNNMDNDMAYNEYLTDKDIELDQKYVKESIAFSRQEYKNYSELSIDYRK